MASDAGGRGMGVGRNGTLDANGTIDETEYLFDNSEQMFDPSSKAPGCVRARHARLAFVDLETTGLSPGQDRIVEIGIVTVDEGRVAEWRSFVNPGRRVSRFTQEVTGICDAMLSDAPRFSEVAAEVRHRLDGRLFVAHNARFDHGFLKSEFERLAFGFDPEVICSVMLSRKLYPQFENHNLDALIARHGLPVEERHRALPDARLVWRFWQRLRRDFAPQTIDAALDALLVQPVLPAHLDVGLIDRLPESSGAYVFYGEGGRALQTGRAANLRQHLRRYFQLERNCARAVRLSREIRDMQWRSTGGMLGARLLQAALSRSLFAAKKNPAPAACFLQLLPSAPSVAQFAPVGDTWPDSDDLFGLFASERKAKNAVRKLADRHRICHRLLGIAQTDRAACRACKPGEPAHCAEKHERLGHLARLAAAAAPLKLSRWPYPGPIAIRERRDLLVVDRWIYLGTAKSEAEVHALLQTRPAPVDLDVFRILAAALPRLRARSIARLDPAPRLAVRGED